MLAACRLTSAHAAFSRSAVIQLSASVVCPCSLRPSFSMFCWIRLAVQDLPAVHIRINLCDAMGALWLHFGPRSSQRLTMVAGGGQPTARTRPLACCARACRCTGCDCAPWTVGRGTVAGVPLRCCWSASRPTALLVVVVVGPAAIVLGPPPPPCCGRRPPCSRSSRPPCALPPSTSARPFVARYYRGGPSIMRPAPPPVIRCCGFRRSHPHSSRSLPGGSCRRVLA